MIHYPRVRIEFCTKCRWNLRAAWYLQELISTFGHDLGEVAMAPAGAGLFQVWIQVSEAGGEQLLWDRKERGGFPDSKDLKQLVRDVIAPNKDLGHSDRKDKPALVDAVSRNATTENTPASRDAIPETEAGEKIEDDNQGCVECAQLS